MTPRRVVAWVAFAGAFGSLIFLVVLQFMNPDMTRTRLVLTYWPVLAVALVFGVIAFVAELGKPER